MREVTIKTSSVGAVRQAYSRYKMNGAVENRLALVQAIENAVSGGMTYKDVSIKMGKSVTWALMTVRNARAGGLI